MVGIVLIGWLAGVAANYLSDVLPVDKPDTPSAGRRFSLWHYLTLPWYLLHHRVCPHCGERLQERAPLLELAMMAIFALAWWRFAASPLRLAIACLFAAFLLTVLVIDFEHRRVLNAMVGPAALLVLGISVLPGQIGLVNALLGGAAGFGFFFLLALLGRGKMGMGDVKLAGVIGLMTGFPTAIYALCLGIFLGGLAALALLLSRRAGRKSTMAYAPYLAVGAIVVMLRG